MSLLQNKISQAKAKLLVEYPLFGALASKLELVENSDIESFKSNGIRLEYNSDFLEELDLAQMEFVFANGAMHASLAHNSRKKRRSSWLWQLATDYAVNDMLVENGLNRPVQAHYSKRFIGLYAEEIYAELKDDILRDELEYEEDLTKDIKQNSEDESQEELNEELFEEFSKALVEAELKNGELPSSFERFFNIKKSSRNISWQDELKATIDKFHKDDYTLLPPSKKLLYSGIYLPSCISQKFKFVVAIDSSGSISQEILSHFLSELDSIVNSLQNYQIELLVCDDRVQSHKTFYSGDILEVELFGGGSTDFRAVFEFIQNNFDDIKLLLYFTDLDGIFPKEEPNYSVKWLSLKESEVPFGDLIVFRS